MTGRDGELREQFDGSDWAGLFFKNVPLDRKISSRATCSIMIRDKAALSWSISSGVT